MVSRQTQTQSGGTILVRESVLKGSGPQGPTGPRGVAGTSAVIKGSKANKAALDAMANTPYLEHNHGYIAEDTGLLYFWYRDNPESPGLYAGQWVLAGRMRGNPGYLNSVAARCVETSADLDTDIIAGSQVVLRWDMNYLDVEVVPVVDAVTTLLANENRPIITGVKMWDGSNAVTTLAFDRVQPTVPPVNAPLDYPMGSAVFLVNVAIDFRPVDALTPRGYATVRMFWWQNNTTRIQVAQQQTYITDIEATLTLMTFIRGADGGQYEIEVESNVSGQIESRRWEWMRVGGGPGPQGDRGIPGEPSRIHPSSPLDNTNSLQTTIGKPGEYILCNDTGISYAWQETPAGSGEYGWAPLGVIRGAKGDANSGFSNFDAVRGAGEGLSGVAQEGYPADVTPDQGAPYPKTASQPRIPYYIKALAQWAEKRIVGRFASAEARTLLRTTPEPGEVSWVGTDDQKTRGLDVFTGTTQNYMRIPVIHASTDSAPSGIVNYPDGTLWLKY